MDLVRASLDAYLDGADGYGKPSDGSSDPRKDWLPASGRHGEQSHHGVGSLFADRFGD
jgi:hypothetical protein